MVISLAVGGIVGAASGYLFGGWVADSITRCIDGFTRGACGAPWLDEDVIDPADAPLAYAPFGGGVGVATALLLLGSLSVHERTRDSATDSGRHERRAP